MVSFLLILRAAPRDCCVEYLKDNIGFVVCVFLLSCPTLRADSTSESSTPTSPPPVLSSLQIRTIHQLSQKIPPPLCSCFIWLGHAGETGWVLALWLTPALTEKSSSTKGWELINGLGEEDPGSYTQWNESFKKQMSVSLVLTSSNFAHLNTIQTDPGLFMW